MAPCPFLSTLLRLRPAAVRNELVALQCRFLSVLRASGSRRSGSGISPLLHEAWREGSCRTNQAVDAGAPAQPDTNSEAESIKSRVRFQTVAGSSDHPPEEGSFRSSWSSGRQSLRNELSESAEDPLFRKLEQAPFRVKRTNSDNFPIYVFYKHNKTRAITVIRKVRGNIHELKKQLELLCRTTITVEGDTLEIHGNHRKIIKRYLEGCGN